MSLRRSESELVEQAVAGSRDALSQLLLLHYDDLKRHITGRIPDDLHGLLVAEDILHQTFVRAASAIGRFQPRHEGSLRAWLATIAENLVKDAEKRRWRERRAPVQEFAAGRSGGDSSRAAIVERIAGDGTAPSMVGQRQETIGRIRAALASLPGDQREVLERFYLQDQSLDEIAEALGATKDSIRGICYRGRKKLRELMGKSSLYFSG